MNTALHRSMFAVALSLAAGAAAAAPISLSDKDLDQISAGGQYSIVAGGGSADIGTVEAAARTKANGGSGASLTKADLKVVAVGEGLEVYGAGESGAGGQVSGGYGAGAADDGRLRLRIKTMAVTKGNGDTMTKLKVQVKSSGGGF